MGNEAQLQAKSSEDTFIEAAGNKHLANAMKQQYKNLTLQQEISKQEQLTAYLNKESEKMRLELANLLVKNPQIAGAMASGNQMPTSPEIKEEPIDIPDDFHNQELQQRQEVAAESAEEDATFKEEYTHLQSENMDTGVQGEQRV